MVYATADLHGFSHDRFLRLLESAHFGEADFLFVLGDVIDRNGDGGIATLLWMMRQDNVQLILGNHEAMLLSCAFLFDEITRESLRSLDRDRLSPLLNWMNNGAEPTIKALHALSKRDPETMAELLEYLREAPVYDTVCAGERDYLLVHAGLGGFDPEKPLSEYALNDLIWHRPSPEERYFSDVMTVLGHTPTAFYGSPGRMFGTPTWIDIDTGAAGGGAPMLLRLEDLRPFYAEQ